MDARQLIDIIRPVHGRTSCTDDDLSNGFYSRKDGSQHKCSRCALLQIIDPKNNTIIKPLLSDIPEWML